MNNQTHNPDFHDYRKSASRDNRLWILAFVAILVLTSFLIWVLGQSEQQIKTKGEMGGNTPRLPAFAAEGHQETADQIRVRIVSLGIDGPVVQFVDKQQLVIELPTDVDRAMVPEVVNIAVKVSEERLKTRPTIALYMAKDPGKGYRTPAVVQGTYPAVD